MRNTNSAKVEFLLAVARDAETAFEEFTNEDGERVEVSGTEVIWRELMELWNLAQTTNDPLMTWHEAMTGARRNIAETQRIEREAERAPIHNRPRLHSVK